MHSAYVKVCIYIYIYVGIGAVQDRASRALCCCIFLWQGFVLLSEKGNINVLVFCCCGGGLCWFFPLFFSLDFLTPNDLYSACPEAQGEMKIVLTLKTFLCNAAGYEH